MTADLTTTVTGTRSRLRSGKSGTQMEREWNANGTHLRTRSRHVPNAFSVRLFLSSTVCLLLTCVQTKYIRAIGKISLEKPFVCNIV